MNAYGNTIIVAYFNGEITSEAIQRYIADDPTNPGWVSTTTGEFRFTQVSGPQLGNLPGQFLAFCIEPREFVSQGSNYTYTVSTLEQGATNIGGMGVAKANLLRELFGRYDPVLSTQLDALHASAMQIAIWEIVRETSGVLNVTNGNIKFQNGADQAAVNLAQSYLSSLDGHGPMLNNLYALTNFGAQDVIIQYTTPEPATFLTLGTALIAGSCLLRRRSLTARRRADRQELRDTAR
jgi:hypothetical protein